MGELDEDRGIVLHVEDDPAFAASVGLLLRQARFRTIVAGDGREALALIDGGLRPDVLIVDFGLPGGMDGCEVAEEVARALGRAPPTILLSGDLTSAGLPWLPGAPIWPLRKPADPEQLLEAVECFAALRRSDRSEAAHRRAASGGSSRGPTRRSQAASRLG